MYAAKRQFLKLVHGNRNDFLPCLAVLTSSAQVQKDAFKKSTGEKILLDTF